MVRGASQFMEKNRDKPFFIYYAMNTPHYPYQGDAKWLEHFKDMPYPRKLYAAFVAAQDQRLGDLFAKVDKLGLRENTIIVFQSDNGHSTEERARHEGEGLAILVGGTVPWGHQDSFAGEGDAHGHESEIAVTLEETYIEWIALPLHSRLRVGQFRHHPG